MTFDEKWRLFNNDERIASMSYEEQAQARKYFLEQTLPTLPTFAGLDPAVQQEVFRTYLKEPPTFAEEPSDEAKRYLDIAERIRKGDETATLEATTQLFYQQMSEQNGLFAKLVQLGNRLSGRDPIEGSEAITDRDSDEYKAVDHLRAMALGSDSTRTWAKAGSLLGSITGVGTAIAAGRVALNAPLNWARNTSTAFASALGNGGRTPFSQWMFRSVIPELAESGVDGLSLMAGHLLNDNPEGDLPEWATPDSRLGKMALAFGYEVAQDMLFWGALNVVGRTAQNVFRTVRKGGFTQDAVEAVVDDDVFKEMTTSILTGREMSKAQLQSLDPDVVRRYRREFAAWAQFERLDELSSDQANQLIARVKGNYDLVQEPSGWKLRDLSDDSHVAGNFATSDSAVDWIRRQATEPPEQTYKAFDAALDDQYEIRRTVTTTLDDTITRNLGTDTIARAFTPDAGGRLLRENIETATRSLVNGSTARKLDVVQLSKADYDQLDVVNRVQKNGDRINLYVPDTVRSMDDLTRVISNIGDDLAPFVKNADNLAGKITYITDLQKGTRSSINVDLVETMAKSANLPVSKTPAGLKIGERVYSDMSEALRDIGMSYAMKDADTLGKVFGEQFGIKIRLEPKTGQYVARKSGKIIDYGKDAQDLGRKLYDHGFEPKIAIEDGPRYLVDNAANTITFDGGVVRGPKAYINDFAAQYFKRKNPSTILKKATNGTISRDNVTTAFQVRSPEWGVIAEFDSFAKANDFLKANRDSLEALRDMGFYKGIVDMRTAGGHYITRNIDGITHTFDTIDEVAQHIKSLPQSKTWTKEISNLNDEYVDQIWDKIDSDQLRKMRKDGLGHPVDWSPVKTQVKDNWHTEGEYRRIVDEQLGGADSIAAKKYSVRLNFQKLRSKAGRLLTSPMYTTVRQYVAETDVTKLLTDFYEPMEKSVKNARGLLAQFTSLIEGVAATGSNGKRITRAVREKALKYLEVNPEDWGALAIKHGDDITGPLGTYITRFRKAMDTFKSTFNIDGYKVISNYLPHIRDMMRKNPDIIARHSKANDVMKELYSGKAPKEVNFFAEYMRTDELVDFVHQTDPQEILARYVIKGVKNMTLGQTYNKLTSMFNELVKSGNMSPHIVGDLQHYLEDVMGMFSDASSKAAAATAQAMKDTFTSLINRFSKETKLSDQASSDMISALHGMTIAATMSFRPWLPVRNMQQVWTTLAGHFGNSRIKRAMNRMQDGDMVTKRARTLRNNGRLRENAPIFGLTKSSFMDGWNRKGMKAYSNSDQYTRLVVDLVVEDAFETAAVKYARGLINEKQFLNLSELSRFDAADQRHIIDLLNNKGYESALDYYGDIVDRETMFSYQAGSNPAAWRGFFGRLFGIFGHYPVYYARNIMNGLSRGTPFQRLQFAGRVVMNTAILWYTFEKAFGISADAFIPWKTMFFDGGPYYKFLNNALSAVAGSPGAPTFSQLRKDAQQMLIPGGLAGRRALEGLDLMQQGKTYEGFLSLMSVPLADTE